MVISMSTSVQPDDCTEDKTDNRDREELEIFTVRMAAKITCYLDCGMI